MKLLDTNGGNTKLKKNNKDIKIRVGGLSLYPNDTICPFRHVAQCAKPCLVVSGRGNFENVKNGRQAKTDFYLNNRKAFIAQLKKELANFEKLCIKNGVVPYIRLNVISDIQWELETNESIWKYDTDKFPNGPYSVEQKFQAGNKQPKPKIDQRTYAKDMPTVIVFKTSNRSNAKTKMKIINNKETLK